MDMRRECKRCGALNEVKEMRYHPNGKDFLCKECSDFEDPKAKTLKKASLPEKMSMKSEGEKTEEVTKYYCRKCKYKFRKKAGVPIKVCPYCGSENIGPQEEISAQNILDDAADGDYY